MMNHKEDTINYLGSVLFIVLCVLCISAFSAKSADKGYDSSQYGLISAFHSNATEVISVKAIQLPSLQKNCLPVLCTNLNLLNENYKIIADDRKITQSIILLQKTQLKIKPHSVCRLYFHLLLTDTSELPSLS
jgi:hypothetical protein